MEIRLAMPEDMEHVVKYDRHIPVERIRACIDNGQVWLLWTGKTAMGVLRFPSLF